MELNKFIFKCLLIMNIITIVLLFGTNIAWFIYESQFQTITENTEINSQKVENIQKVRDIIQTT